MGSEGILTFQRTSLLMPVLDLNDSYYVLCTCREPGQVSAGNTLGRCDLCVAGQEGPEDSGGRGTCSRPHGS